MMATDSLFVAMHLVVLSDVSFCWLSACRHACGAGAFTRHLASPPAQPPNVQTTCLECAKPVVVAAFASGLATVQQRRRAAETRSGSDGQRRKARQKGAAPGHPQNQSARGGGAARSGFAAVLLGARCPRQCRHPRVLRTTGHARAFKEHGHD